MKQLAFISYRRGDTQDAAIGLYLQLRNRFGASQIFMDTNTITAGSKWPARIQQALDKTSVMIVVIGQRWLTASDEYGRRRLDQGSDWVRKEIRWGIEKELLLIPVLISDAKMPNIKGLPNSLKELHDTHALTLRKETWDHDLNILAKRLAEMGFVDNDQKINLPSPGNNLAPISEERLNKLLVKLKYWEPVENRMPWEYPNTRQELRRVYQFPSFAKAMDFMEKAIPIFKKANHHPRWQNQWKTVIV